MTGVGAACALAVVGISELSDLVTGLAIRFGELENLIWNIFRGIPTSPWKGQRYPVGAVALDAAISIRYGR